MQRQCIDDAYSTEALISELGCPLECEKLGVRDFFLLAERVALTLGICGLLHVVL